MNRRRLADLLIGVAMSIAFAPTLGFALDAGLPSVGTLTIDFNDTAPDAVRYEPLTGVATVEEFAELSDITGRQQDSGKFGFFSSPPRPTLLRFTGNGMCLPVGFTDQKNWTGCYKKGGIGTGQIVNGQILTFELIPGGPVGGTMVSDGVLHTTAKQNVVFLLHLDTLAGDNPRTITVYSGLSAVAPLARGLMSNERVCAAGVADSSPDSGADCPVIDLENWQRMSIEVISDGALSLGSQDSVFNLVSYAGQIDCGETTEEVTDPVTGITVQIWRLAENYSDDGAPPMCIRVPYSLQFAGQLLEMTVDYLFPVQTPQWEIKITFDGIDITSLREADNSGTPADERLQPYPSHADHTIDAQFPQGTSQFVVPLDTEYYIDTCFGNPNFDPVTGRLSSMDPPLDSSGIPDWPDHSDNVVGTQVACWFRQQDDLIHNATPTSADESSNLVEKTYWLFVRGDIRLRIN